MKQYTDKDQTSKLLELGFSRPQGWGNKDISNGMSIALYNDGREDFNYSIGELIEFLYCYNFSLSIYGLKGATWQVWAENKIWETELIDALFNMCVTLKEEGVI